MSGGVWHQFISMRDHPNQSFYLEGHSMSGVDGDDDNNDDDNKNNDDNDNYVGDNNNGKDFTLRNAR